MINVEELLRRYVDLPRFSDGRIDYSKTKSAPVLTCFITLNGKILLLKRSNSVTTYKGKWNTVAGYIDEPKPIQAKALEEVLEETGITKELICEVIEGESLIINDANRTWIVFPVLVKLKQMPKLRLNFEHTEAKWILPEELPKYEIVPKLELSLKAIQRFI
ncbi:hypothetical protein DRJ48_03545 [Candidatus Woesearchaeota archaeon]|nr:NUDIX domain-containing protein [Candidatus Woesearchaeota archaeon]RLE42433.1 MAG: hypothetical protein DRJ48_03545 [Candidatus Woesearchaeota archaeon]